MVDAAMSAKQKSSPKSRQERLAAALKRNIGRRKAAKAGAKSGK
jgi:hypothetical protein